MRFTIYNSHDDCLTVDQVLGLRYFESSAELAHDRTIETFPCVQDCPNHCAYDVLSIGSPKDTQSIRLTSIGSSLLTDWSYSDARTSHLCMTLRARRILTIVHRCQDRLVEIVIQSTIFRIVRHMRLCGRQIQDCDLIGHVLVSHRQRTLVTSVTSARLFDVVPSYFSILTPCRMLLLKFAPAWNALMTFGILT